MATDIYPDERLALIATIIERHPEPGPRLVFADWLEERGERTWDTMLGFVLALKRADWPRLMAADWLERDGQRDRAEFIRLQVELARMDAAGVYTGVRPCCQNLIDGHCMTCRVAMATVDRMRRRTASLLYGGILDEFQRRFLTGALANRGNIPNAVYNRGFIEYLRCTWAGCTQHLDAILREQPITRVELTDNPASEMEAITGYPATQMLSGRWSGIEFTLPPVPVPQHIAAYIEALRQHNVGIRQSRPTAPPTVLLSDDAIRHAMLSPMPDDAPASR